MIYRFVDCSFDVLDPAAGERHYLNGHIPGAVFMSVDRDLSDLSRAPNEGRHPLPSPDAFAEAASAAGIGPGVFVVTYDQGMTGGAARLWWLLRHFGHLDVAVLEGGIGAWNGPLVHGHEQVARVSFEPHPSATDTIDAEEIAARLSDPTLTTVDARAQTRYWGDADSGNPMASLDPRAGHIPGAVNAPFAEQSLPAGLTDAQEIAVYCGSGVTAAVTLLRLARAGRDDARLYPGSWSEWSRRDLPIESGAGVPR